ncbi:MAG: response regulator [Xenococcaceae cyanobacterium]
MDKEQQIRLNFLDEAEAYFDSLESHLLGLTQAELDRQQVDTVLRLVHSVKGGAAMMSFVSLSEIAHRLEDFLKILRVRYINERIETEVETLLLQGVDCLRNVSNLNRQGIEVIDADFRERIQSIFEQLRQHLGDLEAEDEDALMKEDENVDPALLVFEEGVETILDRLENQLKELEIPEIAQELRNTAEELINFGQIVQLEPFVNLCQSVQNQIDIVSQSQITDLANRALKIWRRSHALVLLGSIDKLPSDLESDDLLAQNYNTLVPSTGEGEEVETDNIVVAELDLLENDSLELSNLADTFNFAETETELELFENSSLELSNLADAFDFAETETELDLLENSSLELRDLADAFNFAEIETETELELDLLENNSSQIRELGSNKDSPKQSQVEIKSKDSFFSLPLQKTLSGDKMVRVPASQLQQFNNLFEQLVLNRNTINLRLQQLQDIVTLMNQRLSQIESSNVKLRQWYDRALIEGLLAEGTGSSPKNLVSPLPNNQNLLRDRFDTLEMDRYSDIHLICQEQLETIVQLQEVASDIKLGLREMDRAVRDFNYTTKSMQGNVNNTQMLPFAEVVKRFPRLIRELNLQFNKQVNLKIIGENTLFDRDVIDNISDPLIHLLRNAFDHGIETPEKRIATGKPPVGTITIQAKNQGTCTIITIADDGKGISLDKISDRVVKMGIPQEEVSQISEAELLEFIFEPGFSTASEVTELSGRGIGMDIVKTNLQAIGGDVRVTTVAGQGTTFTLRVPFTLSILRVAIIEQAGIIFAIPANSIRELIPLKSETNKIVWHQSELPLVEIDKILVYPRSHRILNLNGQPTIDRPMAIVIGDKQPLAAIQISRFWYEQESTIRPIDSPLPLPPGIVSSVVFGDGKVIPLIEPVVFIEEYLHNCTIPTQSRQELSEDSSLSNIKTILVVDDSVNVRRYLSLTLEKAGYCVEQAKDGQEAVDKLAEGLAVEAIISDIEMPRLDGYGVLEEIKAKAEFANLPIIMLTSRSNEKHRKLAMNLGASAYLSKPYNEQELLQQLEKLLKIATSS